jgi:hypothetical protein
MKTLLVILIAMFFGMNASFAQQNTSVGKPKLVKAGTVSKSANKTTISVSKSTAKTATVNSDQTLTTNNNSATSKNLVRIPVRGDRKSVSAKSALKEK